MAKHEASKDDIQGVLLDRAVDLRQNVSVDDNSSQQWMQRTRCEWHESTTVSTGKELHSSSPLAIGNASPSREKEAELFPDPTDICQSPGALLSGPSSMESSGYSLESATSKVSLSSLEEQIRKNSLKLANSQKGTSKRAVETRLWNAKLIKRVSNLEKSQREMEYRLEAKLDQLQERDRKWIDKGQTYFPVSKERVSPRTPACQTQSATMSWIVPYTDMKQCSMKSIQSSTLEIPWAQDLQARLYIEGIGKGQGSYLSIAFSWVKRGKDPKATENYPVNICVQVINQGDSSETIEKKIHSVSFQEDIPSFKAENLYPTITKLIPISTVKDASLGYLVDGRLVLNISADDSS